MVERLASYGWERWPQRMTLDGAQYLCRWCAKPLTGQQTSYCSYKCRKEIEVRCLWDALKVAIYDRDGGVCKKCGVNFEDLEEFFKWYDHLFRKYSTNPPDENNPLFPRYSSDLYHSVVIMQEWPWPNNLRRDLGYG